MHDKSRPAHESKKPGKTLKQKRAEKREEHVQQQHVVIPTHTPRKSS